MIGPIQNTNPLLFKPFLGSFAGMFRVIVLLQNPFLAKLQLPDMVGDSDPVFVDRTENSYLKSGHSSKKLSAIFVSLPVIRTVWEKKKKNKERTVNIFFLF